MAVASTPQTISPLKRGWRHFGAWVCQHMIVPAEVVDRDAAMAATDELLQQGYGVLNIINHFVQGKVFFDKVSIVFSYFYIF